MQRCAPLGGKLPGAHLKDPIKTFGMTWNEDQKQAGVRPQQRRVRFQYRGILAFMGTTGQPYQPVRGNTGPQTVQLPGIDFRAVEFKLEISHHLHPGGIGPEGNDPISIHLALRGEPINIDQRGSDQAGKPGITAERAVTQT